MSSMDLADGLRLMSAATGEGRFGHREHLRFGWNLLREAEDAREAERIASMTIRHAAKAAGNPDKYHHTMTLFWIRLLAHLQSIGVETIDQAIEEHPMLTDPGLPNRHWSNVHEPDAKLAWVEPDLQPMP